MLKYGFVIVFSQNWCIHHHVIYNDFSREKMKNNHKPLQFELKGEAGKRVALAAAKRVIKTHNKEIKALAYK